MPEKIKVLMVGNDLSVKGGITTVIRQLLGHDWKAEQIELSFVPTYINRGLLSELPYYAQAYHNIRHQLHTSRPDVVHIHMSYKGSFERKVRIHSLCVREGIPDILHLHGSQFKQWYDHSNHLQQSRIRKLLREAAMVFVLGGKWADIIRNIEPAANLRILQNAVKIPAEKASWNEESFRVLYLGVLIKRKGVDDLLKAAKRLKEIGRLRNLHFVIAGEGSEGDALQRTTLQYGLEGDVEFRGWINGQEKETLLQSCQLLVLPSHNEGLPVAVLEAISYGMPVVATDVGDMSAAVLHQKNGYLIQPGDYTALADHIANLSSDRELYEAMSAASKEIASTRFSEEDYFQKISCCYRALTKRP